MFTLTFALLGFAFFGIFLARTCLNELDKNRENHTIIEIRLNRYSKPAKNPARILYYGMHKRELLTALVSLTKRIEPTRELIGNTDYFRSTPRNW
jgi:hypothetical protein